jgi:hypothetical protein
MGRWLKSDHTGCMQPGTARWLSKRGLAAGSVAALLLITACGDKEADQAGGGNTTEAVAAAAIDPAQAPIIQKAIEDYLLLIEGPAEQRIVHHGAVKVTPGTDAFDVSIEGVYVGPAGEGRLDVGTIGYRLTPKGSDGYLASNLTHAPSIPFKDKDGKETGALTFTTKAFSGEWSSSLQTFLALDWQAVDLVAKDNAPDGGNFTAASLGAHMGSTDKGNGLFDQTGTFELNTFSAMDTEGGVFGLGKLAGTVEMSGIKLKEYVSKMREMQTLMAEIAEATAKAQAAAEAAAKAAVESGNTTPTVAVNTGISDEQAAKLGGMIKGMAGIVAAVNYDFVLTDISFKEKDGSEPFRLAKGDFDVGFAGLDAEKASFNFAIGHEGLVVKDPDMEQNPLFAKLLPASGRLDLNLTDVPSKELWQLIGDNFPGLITADPARSEAAAGVMFIAMQQLLQKAPMKLAVAPSGLASEVLQLDATGAFDVKPEAIFGLVGALDVNLHGLDEAMKLANEAAQSSPDAAQIVGGLAMIQSMAKRETGADGKPVDRLKLEVDAMGDAKVNGMSLSGM